MTVYTPLPKSVGAGHTPGKQDLEKRRFCSAHMGYSGSQPWYLLVNVYKFPRFRQALVRLHHKDSRLLLIDF